MPRAFLSMLLYLFSASVRVLLANAVGLSMLLSGASSLTQLILVLVCSKAPPSSNPYATLSVHSGLILS